MKRTILHCDMNNFYASVECQQSPELWNVPLVVCGDPEKRHGVVLSKNEVAKAYGIKTGDVLWEAKKKCPSLVSVLPHFDLYSEFSQKIFDYFVEFTNQVEPFGSDECWLDVSGCQKLFGDGEKIAQTIRQGIKDRFSLTASVGVSFNKIFAKLGSDLKKPDATTIITEQNFKQKIWGLPASDMMGVGKKTYQRLKNVGITTIGDLANTDQNMLKNLFGINGEKIWQYANGQDNEPVREYIKSRQVESIGHGMTTIKDLTSFDEAQAVLTYLSGLVAARMRAQGFRCGGIHLAIRDKHLSTKSKQQKLAKPVFTANDIASNGFALLKSFWSENPPLRSMAISVYDLTSQKDPSQLSFFDQDDQKKQRLEAGIEKIRQKYGKSSLVLATLLGKEFLYDKNESEDFLPFKR